MDDNRRIWLASERLPAVQLAYLPSKLEDRRMLSQLSLVPLLCAKLERPGDYKTRRPKLVLSLEDVARSSGRGSMETQPLDATTDRASKLAQCPGVRLSRPPPTQRTRHRCIRDVQSEPALVRVPGAELWRTPLLPSATM